MPNMLRSWDGLKLYAVSSDGTLAAFDFEPEELEGIAPHSIQQQYLQKFGFCLPPLPEGWSHTNLQVQVSSSEQRMTPPPSPNRSSHQPQSLNSFGASSASTGHEVVNTLIAKRNTKKRARQNFLGPGRDSNPPASLANASSYHDSFSSTHPRSHPVAAVIASGLNPEISESTASVHSLDCRPSGHLFPDMAMNVPIDSLGVASSAGAKRKLSVLDIEDRPTKARTLGGDRVRGNTPNIVKEIPSIPSHRAVVPSSPQAEKKEIFSAPPTLTYLFLKVKDMGDDILECKNAENGGKFSCSRL
jgi:protein HIRA/HIR1